MASSLKLHSLQDITLYSLDPRTVFAGKLALFHQSKASAQPFPLSIQAQDIYSAGQIPRGKADLMLAGFVLPLAELLHLLSFQIVKLQADFAICG